MHSAQQQMPTAERGKPDRSAVGNPLLMALGSKDWPLARALLGSPEGSKLLAGKTVNGFTALMAAAAGSLPLDVVELILNSDVSEIVAERKWVRQRRKGASDGGGSESGSYWTASDFAQDAGNEAMAARLRLLEAEAPASHSSVKGGAERCTVCSERVRARPKIAVLQDQANRGEESNPLVLAVLGHADARLALSRVELHRVTECKHFRKELTECMGAIDGLQRLCTERLGHPLDGSWHVIDLCSGRSLATALLTLLTGCTVTAVDRVGAGHLPHYAECGLSQVNYVQLDLHAPSFLGTLSHLAAMPGGSRSPRARSRTAILGIHCCGSLSERAIEAFAAIEADACVLMPCCLPSKASAPPSVYVTRDQRSQYLAWSEWLRQRLSEAGGGESACICTSTIHSDVLSPRNALVCAARTTTPCSTSALLAHATLEDTG